MAQFPDSPASLLERLPPLKDIEAFIATMKAGSFTEAAHRLGLSASTLSRRVKALEAHVGDQLLVRGKSSVRLTPAGQVYFQAAEEALGVLASGRSKVIRIGSEPVSITISHYFIRRFISDHLAEFEKQYPHIALSIDTSGRIEDLRTGSFDIGVRFGVPADWPGIPAETIFVSAFGPVCAPTLRGNRPDIPKCIEALSRHTLLHHSGVPRLWPRFFEAVGMKGMRGASDRYFDDPDLLYAATVQGLGIGLVDPVFQSDLLANGGLVQPVDTEIATGDGYCFAFKPGSEQREAVRTFCDWLVSLDHIQKLRERQAAFGY